MKQFLLLIVAAALLNGCTHPVQKNTIRMMLHSGWTFHKEGSPAWMKAVVPGCVHTDLQKNDSIPDPFLNDNELKLQWIDKTDWEYQTSFDVSADILAKNTVELVFEGLDTYADVYLNDSLVLRSDNMFCNWKLNCKKMLKPSGNKLFIHFHSAIKEGLKKLAASPYALPAVNDHSKDGGLGNKAVSPFVRKAPFQFGWDWGPRFVTSGIWRPVYLSAWNRAVISDVYVKQDSLTDEKAELSATIEITADGSYTAEIKISDTTTNELLAEIRTELKPGINKVSAALEFKNPKRWWPRGYGDQPLYGIRTEVEVEGSYADERTRAIGLRTIRLVQKKDTIGESFGFEVNGIPVFMRGANYIPCHAFPSEVSDSIYRMVIGRAADANMNMIRIWGGGIYESDIVYDLCDKYGILVWQDLMFACAMYPGDAAFKQNITKEINQNVTRLRNHPCIALWCGNNELENGWNYYLKNGMNYTPKQVEEVWNNYLSVFDTLIPGILNNLEVMLPYRRTSALPGKGIYEKTPVDKLLDVEWRSGDWHNYWVWGGKKPFSLYDQVVGRFMSEWGFQAFPEMSTVKTFSPSENLSLSSSMFELHQKSAGGNALIDYYMNLYYKRPKDLPMYVYVSGLLQAEAMRTATESYRRNKPHCLGTMYWQLNDMWPVVSWSTVDFYNRKKPSHYTIARCYKNIIVSTVEEKNKIKVYVVSDDMKAFKGDLSMCVCDFSSRFSWKETIQVEIPANSSVCVYEVDLGKIKDLDRKRNLLYVSLKNNEKMVDNKIHYFVSPRELDLTKPDMRSYTKGDTIIIVTTSLAKNVFLQMKDGENDFSDNYFDLGPWETKKVIYTGKEKNLKPVDYTLTTLTDSYQE